MSAPSSTLSNTIATPKTASESVALPRLLWVAPLTIIVAVAANVALYIIANALFGVEWLPIFTLSSVIGSTVIFLIIATLIFAAVARFSKRPLWLYRRIAVVALFLSFLMPLSALFGMAAPPDVNAGAAPLDTVITMLVMHVIAYAISVTLFTRLTRKV